MRTLTLNTAVGVTLNGSGNGTAFAGPTLPGEVWFPTIVSVSASSNVKEASCKIYSGALAIQQTFVDGTLSGSTGDSTQNIAGKILRPGQYIFASWAGGDTGAQATATITGTKQVP